MRLVFRVPANQAVRPKVLCEADVYFDADSIFWGMRLTGFTIWQGQYGPYLTFPARESKHQVQGKDRQYWEFLRAQDSAGPEGTTAIMRTKDTIMKAWYQEGSPGLR